MKIYHKTTPNNDGFRMPAEFEEHSGCWMLWPERPDIWRAGAIPAQKLTAEVANIISNFEEVTLGVSATQYFNAKDKVNNNRVRFVEISYDDVWIRDTSAVFLVNSEKNIRGVSWQFNAWGGELEGLYYPWDKDNAIASKMLAIDRIPEYEVDFILEGGGIHTDGEGTLLLVEECVMNPNRNHKKLSKLDVEVLLRDYLNVQKIIWLPRGIVHDETGGHIDNLCCFARPTELLLAWETNTKLPQFSVSNEAYRILSREIDAKGREFTIHKIPMPPPQFITQQEAESFSIGYGGGYRIGGYPLAASYLNFYFANGALILPIFGIPSDTDIIKLFTKLFPKRKIVPFMCREFLLGGGNLHCLTSQVP